jgi:RHS repeat-associated protein
VAEAEIANPLRFQGQYEDVETGLFYNRHRYYDLAVAPYAAPDPIGLEGDRTTMRMCQIRRVKWTRLTWFGRQVSATRICLR